MAYFQISAVDAMIDEAVAIELHELAPHTLAVIRAQFQDDFGHTWASQALFQSDALGKIKLQSARPQSGSYQQPDPMGLFWSMQAQTDGTENRIHRPATNSLTPLSVTLTAENNHKIIAEATLIRRFLNTAINRIDIQEDGLIATLFMPAQSIPRTTAMVFGGSGGGFTWSHQVASVLASRGCATMAIAYFDWRGEFGLPQQFTELPLECFARAHGFLTDQTDLSLNDLTAIGYSKGAELALLLATIYPEIKRVVAYVPSSLVWCGFSQQGTVSQSSWCYQSQPVPFALFANGHFDANGWQDQEMIAAAAIPVEKISAPVLLISATKDNVWPSTQMADNMLRRMKAVGRTQASKHLSLAQAGHSLSIPSLPTITYGGVEQVSNAQAERQAWVEVLHFLDLPTMFGEGI